MRGVGHRDDHRELGAQLDDRAGVRAVAHERERAVGLDARALEEVDVGHDVAPAEPVLGQRHREAVARRWGGRRARRRRRTSPRCAGGSTRRRARRAWRSRVGGDREEHATHVGEQERPGAEVGLPLHLDRVGHVEPFERLRGVVHEQVGAGVALEVGEPERRAPGQHARRVAARARSRRPRAGAPARRARPTRRRTPTASAAGTVGWNAARRAPWARAWSRAANGRCWCRGGGGGHGSPRPSWAFRC